MVAAISVAIASRGYFAPNAKVGVAVYLWLSAFPIAIWLSLELEGTRQLGRVGDVLRWCGTWSYSLYITHPIAQLLWKRIAETLGPNTIPYFLCDLLLILAFAYAFYLLIEGPSVKVAALLSKKVLHRARVDRIENSARTSRQG